MIEERKRRSGETMQEKSRRWMRMSVAVRKREQDAGRKGFSRVTKEKLKGDRTILTSSFTGGTN